MSKAGVPSLKREIKRIHQKSNETTLFSLDSHVIDPKRKKKGKQNEANKSKKEGKFSWRTKLIHRFKGTEEFIY